MFLEFGGDGVFDPGMKEPADEWLPGDAVDALSSCSFASNAASACSSAQPGGPGVGLRPSL